MKEGKLKFTKTEKGVYVYLETPERDILLSQVFISREKDQMLLIDALNLIDFKLLAYREFRQLLETTSMVLAGDPKYEDLQLKMKEALSLFKE